MSAVLPGTEGRRVLACVLCQQRKVKCDRKFPCGNCIKSRAQCVPAAQTSRRRKRRFPERELLERLRKYEDLLRQNNIQFEPLHKDSAGEKGSPSMERGLDSDNEPPKAVGADWSSPSTTVNSERGHGARDMWYAARQGYRDHENDSESSDDDVLKVVVKNAWDHLFENGDNILFGSREMAVDITALHPEPAQIFRLWQIYLENIDPMLKVTHTPSLQGRIAEAVGDLAAISPAMEALMFSIYCTAAMSLKADDVQTIFGSSKDDLLSRCQFGCQQALLNCKFLRSSDRDCLTALYLYLVSVRRHTVPRSLSSMLSVAIRIAERMGIHNESDLAKCTPLEAEMRRRLWWSLVLFDTRIGEMADWRSSALIPTWDCRIPLNVNDSGLRPEMKEPPKDPGKSSEALFAVVRGELAEFLRNTTFYLDFVAPALKPIAKNVQNGPISEGGELVALEKMIEDKYLKSCDPENPLHFMTIWMARGFLAKYRLVEYRSKYHGSSIPQTEAQRDTAFSHALDILKCDTKVVASPLTKGFLWLAHLYFPFPAFIHLVQDLRRRPNSRQAEQAWEIMSDNYEAHFGLKDPGDNRFFRIFADIIMRAWEVREVTLVQLEMPFTKPKFVWAISRALEEMRQKEQTVQNAKTAPPHDTMDIGADEFLMSMPTNFGGAIYGLEGQPGYAGLGQEAYPHIPVWDPLGMDANQLDWTAMNWSSINEPPRLGNPYPHMPGQDLFDADINQSGLAGEADYGTRPP